MLLSVVDSNFILLHEEKLEMASKIFVGNLPFSVDKDALEKAFTQYGKVVGAKVIIDRKTNRSRGYGFVEFEQLTEAEDAVNGMNEKEFEGRNLTVSLAKNQE